jgi:hypothetical protein
MSSGRSFDMDIEYRTSKRNVTHLRSWIQPVMYWPTLSNNTPLNVFTLKQIFVIYVAFGSGGLRRLVPMYMYLILVRMIFNNLQAHELDQVKNRGYKH